MIHVVTDFQLHILGGDDKRHWCHIGKVQEKPNTNRDIVSSTLVINTEMNKEMFFLNVCVRRRAVLRHAGT